jgi:Protein of unknown function (DUF2490)
MIVARSLMPDLPLSSFHSSTRNYWTGVCYRICFDSSYCMRLLKHVGIWCLSCLVLMPALGARGQAQTSQLLPEIDAYYKISSPVRVWLQAKETAEAGNPVTAEIGPSLDFYVKSPMKLADVSTFDLDDSKSRVLVVSVGYRYLPAPDTTPTNRFEPVFAVNFPIAKLGLLTSDRNRADLDWRAGSFTWRYRNRLQLERTIRTGSYHPSLYASAEFFYESQYSKWADTALYAGCLFPIGKHFEFNPYYEHQNQTGKSPNQQYNQLGLMLNIFYGRK